MSFKGGKEVPYGTKDSVRPEYYKHGTSVEVKNYNLQTSQGRNNLVRNVTKQAKKRGSELPKDTRQLVKIDVRGQNIPRETLSQVRNRIVKNSDKTLRQEDIEFLR